MKQINGEMEGDTLWALMIWKDNEELLPDLFKLNPITEEWYQRTQIGFCLLFDPKSHVLLFKSYFVTCSRNHLRQSHLKCLLKYTSWFLPNSQEIRPPVCGLLTQTNKNKNKMQKDPTEKQLIIMRPKTWKQIYPFTKNKLIVDMRNISDFSLCDSKQCQ